MKLSVFSLPGNQNNALYKGKRQWLSCATGVDANGFQTFRDASLKGTKTWSSNLSIDKGKEEEERKTACRTRDGRHGNLSAGDVCKGCALLKVLDKRIYIAEILAKHVLFL